jgi:Ni/Co efflux regulator RcnB
MKKISYVLAALATIAIAAPAVAEDKPTMREGMHEGMHHHMDHRMDMHHHHHHHSMLRHMMRREGM